MRTGTVEPPGERTEIVRLAAKGKATVPGRAGGRADAEDPAGRVTPPDAAGTAPEDRGLTVMSMERPPEDEPGRRSVYHLFVVELDERDRVREALRADGVGAGVHYPTPVHLQPAFAHLGLGPGSLPAAEAAASRVLSLPCFPGIEDAEIERVGDALRRALA